MSRSRRALLVAVGVLLVLTGCSDSDPVVAPQTTTSVATTVATMTTVATAATTVAPSTTGARPATAPWSAAKLKASQVPAVFLTEWRAGGARADCAVLAPTDLGPAATGTPRRAQFGIRAWAVAWDVAGAPGRQASGQPCADCGRGTVVVAGTTVEPPAGGPLPGASVLTKERRWADGSLARYGLEGGSGPAYLAQLVVAGQKCMYNVSSFLGQAHLERLLESLRFVEGAP